MTERPTFIDEQTGKLKHLFRTFNKAASDGEESNGVLYQNKETGSTVWVNEQFVRGMMRAAQSIKDDMQQVGQGDLFYKTHLLVRRQSYPKNND